MRDLVTLSVKLAAMMLIAALCLGATNMITAGPIQTQERRLAEAARSEVLPGAEGFEAFDLPQAPASIVGAYRSTGGVDGYVFEVSTSGFGGAMGVTVGIAQDGTVSGVRVGTHSETPGLGSKSTDESFYGQYAGKAAMGDALSVVKRAPKDNEIQAITAATITSRAVTGAVNDAMEAYKAAIGGAQ